MISDDPYGEIQMLVSGLPGSAKTIVARSKQFRAAGEVDLAIALLERAVIADPIPTLLAEQADIFAEEGLTDKALDLALTAVVSDPMASHGREVLGRVLVTALPQAFDHLVTIANLFDEEDEPDFAEDLLRRAVTAHPKDIPIRLEMARFYADHGRVPGCIVELQALLRLEPEHAEAQVMLAAAFTRQGNLQSAQSWLDKARANGVAAALADPVDAKIRSKA